MNAISTMSLLAVEAASSAVVEEGTFSMFIKLLTVFLLAMWVGFEVITKVPPILHTPLTSGSNAISGITIVGSMVALGCMAGWFTSFLGFAATVFAAINAVGGFLVTHRMLRMFKKK